MAKKVKYIISIPEPCSEDWNKMSVVEKGRYCDVCATKVYDFTSFSDHRLAEYLDKNEGKLCGRLSSQQLHRTISSNSNSSNILARASAVIALMTTSISALAQNTEPKAIKTVQQSSVTIKTKEQKPSNIKSDSSEVLVSGRVIDEFGEVVPFAKVLILGGYKTGAYTDMDGDFLIRFKAAKEPLKMQISYIGYKTITKDISVKFGSAILDDIILKEEHIQLGGAVVIRKITPKMKREIRKENRAEKRRLKEGQRKSNQQ